MPTNKVVLRSIEELIADYQPVYQPIYPLFLGKSQAYPSEVGQLTFKRLQAVGDIRAHKISPKSSEIKQIGVNENSKVFKKYFFANQYVQSNWQDLQGIEDAFKQVLDEHQKHQDDLLLLGEGTSDSTMVNNGLFWSGDENYDLEVSVEVKKGTAVDHLLDFHKQTMAIASMSDQSAGEKLLLIYGTSACSKFDAVYAASNNPFKQVLQGVLAGWKIAKVPSDVTPSATNGIIAVNRSQVKLNYTLLPGILSQGINEEKMYAWSNFALGSMMLDCLVSKAIIRQPFTFEA